MFTCGSDILTSLPEPTHANGLVDPLGVPQKVPPGTSDSQRELEDLLGVSIRELRVELSLDASAKRLASWKFVAIGADGATRVIRQYTFSDREVMSAEEVADAHFGMDVGEAGRPSTPLSFPNQILIPYGELKLNSKNVTEQGRLRVILTGPQTLVVEIEIEPSRAAPVQVPWHGTHQIKTPDATVFWSSGGTDDDWPRLAMWDDGHHRYDLSVLTAPPNGWAETDLTSLVHVLATWDGI